MNKVIKLVSVLSFLVLSSVWVGAQNEGNDVFIPISKYISQGNAENLSAWFADNLEISIMSNPNNSSKSQAKQIMKSFFSSHTPRSFDINHVAGRMNMKYAVGTLNAGGENFNVTIFIRCKDNKYLIQQLKIERVQ